MMRTILRRILIIISKCHLQPQEKSRPKVKIWMLSQSDRMMMRLVSPEVSWRPALDWLTSLSQNYQNTF